MVVELDLLSPGQKSTLVSERDSQTQRQINRLNKNNDNLIGILYKQVVERETNCQI